MSTQAKRVAFHTLGCKLNFSETATISRDLLYHGFEKVNYRDKADIYVLYTCSVTENADKKARKLIGYSPKIVSKKSLSGALKKTFDWYKTNQNLPIFKNAHYVE